MNYILRGRLHTAICDGHENAIAFTKVRLYSVEDERNAATAYTAAQSKELIQVFDEKEIKARKKRLLAETKTDANGNYEFKLDGDKLDYNGGIVAVVLFYDEIPEYGQDGTSLPKKFSPFEVLMDVIQPKWRETNGGLIAGWNYGLLKRVWCFILARLDIWMICGTLLNCKSGEALSGIEVIAMDDDIITDDLLGSAVTNDKGEFCIYYRSIDFKKTFLSPWINVETTPIFSFDNGPDIYFKFEVGGSEIFAESPSEAQKPSRKNVGNCLCVRLCLDDVVTPGPKDPPAAFYQIGYARKYHPVINIDPVTGRTTGKATADWNEQAFFSTLDLRGSLSKKLNGQPVEYKFEYAEVNNPSIDVGAIPVAAWNDVTPADIAKGEIATRLTQFFPEIKHESYVIHGINGPTATGNEVEVTFNGNWVQAPQYNGGGFDIFFNGSLIKLISNKLASGIVDKAALIPGSSSAPLEQNRYFALRMKKRELGNPGSETMAGFSRPLAIFNTVYKDVPQGGTWDPLGKSSEFGIATLDLQELVDGGSCAKITNTLTANYTAANPNLGAVSLQMFGPGGPHNFQQLVATTPGEQLNGQAQYTGADNTVDPNDVSNLPNCAFEVRLTAELNLTNGEQQHHNIWDRVLYCKHPNP